VRETFVMMMTPCWWAWCSKASDHEYIRLTSSLSSTFIIIHSVEQKNVS